MSRSWMKKLCGPMAGAHSREHSAWMHSVVMVGDGEAAWSLATNGRRLLGLRDGGIQARRDGWTQSLLGPALRQTTEFLTAPVTDQRTFDLGDLRLWLGPRERAACPDCGRSDAPASSYCGYCDGDGWVEPDRQCVRLWPGGAYFNPQLLSGALPKALGSGPAAFGLQRMRAKRDLYDVSTVPLVVEGGDGVRWRSITMPLTGEYRDDARTAPTYVPGIGSLWHLRDGPQRGILRDWCEDQGIDLDEIDPANRYVGMVAGAAGRGA